MSTPPRTPRLPSRSSTNDDSYTWLGVIWLVMLAGGFLALVMTIISLFNLQVLGAILGVIGLNVAGYICLGRLVAKRIAETTPEPESEPE